MKEIVLATIVSLAASTAHAETWRCVTSTGHAYTASQKVPVDRCKMVSKDNPYAGVPEPTYTQKPEPRIGMTQQQVIANTSWGQPNDRHRTTTASGTSEQWVYYGSRYLYFKDGILTAIQD